MPKLYHSANKLELAFNDGTKNIGDFESFLKKTQYQSLQLCFGGHLYFLFFFTQDGFRRIHLLAIDAFTVYISVYLIVF